MGFNQRSVQRAMWAVIEAAALNQKPDYTSVCAVIGISDPITVFHQSGQLCADVADSFKAQYGERYRQRYREWPMLPNVICARGTDQPSYQFDGWYTKACQTVDGIDIEAGENPADAVTANRDGYVRRAQACLHEFCRELVAERDRAARTAAHT